MSTPTKQDAVKLLDIFDPEMAALLHREEKRQFETIGLIASVPKLGSGVKVLPSIPGSVPDLSMLPKGCRFAPRCKYATERCHNEEPSLFEVSPQQKCRCWLAEPTGKEDK